MLILFYCLYNYICSSCIKAEQLITYYDTDNNGQTVRVSCFGLSELLITQLEKISDEKLIKSTSFSYIHAIFFGILDMSIDWDQLKDKLEGDHYEAFKEEFFRIRSLIVEICKQKSSTDSSLFQTKSKFVFNIQC